MYRMKLGIKKNPARRWALPDRVFFGNGACHILAGVFLEMGPLPAFFAERIIPGEGFAGNHIYVTNAVVAFDYHGYSSRQKLLEHHTTAWAREYAEGWNCVLEQVDFDLLNTAELNCRKMVGPEQFSGDSINRARKYIERIDHGTAMKKIIIKNL